jgi:hypothetical protein
VKLGGNGGGDARRKRWWSAARGGAAADDFRRPPSRAAAFHDSGVLAAGELPNKLLPVSSVFSPLHVTLHKIASFSLFN